MAREMFASPQITSTVCVKCGGSTKRKMPTMNGPATSYEDPDGQSGRKWLDGQADILKHRKDKYFYEVEVPRMVASGTYSVETMLENEWIFLNDDGSIGVHTKPPYMR